MYIFCFFADLVQKAKQRASNTRQVILQHLLIFHVEENAFSMFVGPPGDTQFWGETLNVKLTFVCL